MKLQPKLSMKELPCRCPGNGGAKTMRYGRFIGAVAAILAVTAVSLCAVVFAMSVLIRDGDPAQGLSTLDPMFLAAGEPTPGMLRFGKIARLSVASPREGLTADAIVAAYQRALASPTTRQIGATPIATAAITEDRGETVVQRAAIPTTPDIPKQAAYSQVPQHKDSICLSGTDIASISNDIRQFISYASESAVADATARDDRQLPLPEAKPPFDGRHIATINQRRLSTGAETGKPTPQTGDQLAALPEHDLAVESSGEPLSKRVVPDARIKSGLDWPGRSNHVAIYDISAGLVYLPDGERLEAHSGVGRMRDNPSFANVKMRGPTPPATYALSLREQSFHGVDAIRLTPVNGTAPFGRDGLLAHSYMLRRPGDSNGCVAFANYNRFLKAFRNNEVDFMVVVPQLKDHLTGLDSSPVRG